GPAQLARTLDHAADDRLMPNVHPIEVADGGDAATGQVGLFQRVVEYEHFFKSMLSAAKHLRWHRDAFGSSADHGTHLRRCNRRSFASLLRKQIVVEAE